MDYVQIGKNIYTYRKAKRLTQKQLAELIDRAESSIQKYEKGDVEIPNTVLQKIADTLEIPLQYIIDWEQQKDLNIIIAGIDKVFQSLLLSMGYRLVYRPENNKLGEISVTDTNDNVISVPLKEMEKIQCDTESYIRFKIHELFAGYEFLE